MRTLETFNFVFIEGLFTVLNKPLNIITPKLKLKGVFPMLG